MLFTTVTLLIQRVYQGEAHDGYEVQYTCAVYEVIDDEVVGPLYLHHGTAACL